MLILPVLAIILPVDPACRKMTLCDEICSNIPMYFWRYTFMALLEVTQYVALSLAQNLRPP
jgi:hypothetical protein